MSSAGTPRIDGNNNSDYDPLPEPDYDHLDRSSLQNIQDSTDCPPASPINYDDDSDDCHDRKQGPATGGIVSSPQYILGTLIVRVVAARDLEPVVAPVGGLGQLLSRPSRDRYSRLRNTSSTSGGGMGYANPYASVRFYEQTQRTTKVMDTLDPIWPRGEAMYLDVSLPTASLTHGDDPRERTVAATAAAPSVTQDPLPRPILTIALFHASSGDDSINHNSNMELYPTKKAKSGQVNLGDSDEPFLGMVTVDVTPLLTGKEVTLDEWLPLTGTSNDQQSRATLRLVCEYEASDPPPRPGDTVRFTQFCTRADLYPVPPGRSYHVEQVMGDHVLVSYPTPEGWQCTFQAHRFMFHCEEKDERHQDALEFCQDELANLAERLAQSPLLHTVTETVDRLPDDGLVVIGMDLVKGGASLMGRWWNGGVDTAVQDIAYATNWDGRFQPPMEDDDPFRHDVSTPIASSSLYKEMDEPDEALTEPALPGMPCCPITGESMRDPVVAADGHTYERAAIARWLQTSDKSPLTGSLLSHKELVPNYGLLSSVQEAAAASVRKKE